MGFDEGPLCITFNQLKILRKLHGEKARKNASYFYVSLFPNSGILFSEAPL